ncbi:MAG: hypothetical protein AAF620_00715 [Bacteroidota bacterium]
MTRIKQKHVERYVLGNFLENIDLQIPIIGIDNFESPDFVLKCPNRKISVEHTRYIHPKHKQIEEFRKKIIDTAKEKFESIHSQPLRVFFHYSRRIMDTKINPKSYYVDLLVQMVENIYLSNKDRNFVVSTKRNKRENIYIDRVSISNDIDRNLWQWIGAHLVEFADLDKLQKIINAKSMLTGKYQIETDEKWLLIEASKGFKSSSYRFDHIIRGELQKGEFDRVFLFDCGPGDIFEA